MQMTPHDVSLAWCRADVPWQLAHSDTQSCDTVVQCIPLIHIDLQCPERTPVEHVETMETEVLRELGICTS
jgi:hypothetical protein